MHTVKMAKVFFQLSLFFAMLFMVAFQPSIVSSTETGHFGSMPAGDQEILSEAMVRPGRSVICDSKKELLHNLEQLSFYLKADCQNITTSFIGCSCWPPSCLQRCTPVPACCSQNITSLVNQLEGLNLFYASHYRELFGGGPAKCSDEAASD